MKRVKDPKKSIHFYRDLLGMTLIAESHHPEAKFTNYFLAHLSEEEKLLHNSSVDPSSTEAKEFMSHIFSPVLELTHNHGTEDDESFKYYNGNDQGNKIHFSIQFCKK